MSLNSQVIWKVPGNSICQGNLFVNSFHFVKNVPTEALLFPPPKRNSLENNVKLLFKQTKKLDGVLN